MTKAELVKENEDLKKKLKNLHEGVEEGIKEVLDNTCSESLEHIEAFCAIAGFSMPTTKMIIEVPYGTNIMEIQDDNFDVIDFTIVNNNYKG